jgi:hypothetical protein
MVPRLRASSAVGALPRGPRADRTNRPRPSVVPERGHAGWIGSGGEGSFGTHRGLGTAPAADREPVHRAVAAALARN